MFQHCCKDIVEYDVIGNGTHAWYGYTLNSYMLSMGRWYRSKEKLVGHNNQYAGYLTNKKWHLNEVLPLQYETMRLFILIMTFKEMANHLLYFQQVGIIYNIQKVIFTIFCYSNIGRLDKFRGKIHGVGMGRRITCFYFGRSWIR